MQAESRACVTWWMPDFQWHPFGKLPRNHQLKPGLTTFTVTFAMRLIDVHNFQLYEFFGSQIPERYAILSHTWGAGITDQDGGPKLGRGPLLTNLQFWHLLEPSFSQRWKAGVLGAAWPGSPFFLMSPIFSTL